MKTQLLTRIGPAALTRKAFRGENLLPVSADLLISNAKNPEDFSALMDLSAIEQLNGNLKTGLNYQSRALRGCNMYRTFRDKPGKFRLLVFAAPIQLGGNTPVEFLLEQSEFEIVTYYVIPNGPNTAIPEHDISFVAAPGDHGPNRQFLKSIEEITNDLPTKVLNSPHSIAKLERDILPDLLWDIEGLQIPRIFRVNRGELQGSIGSSPSSAIKDLRYPVIIRPVGSHAGRGLEKLHNSRDLFVYLQAWVDKEFFVSEFIDYASPQDGLFRKYRIIFIDGKSYPCHMAISEQWKIWYLNAGMNQSKSKRDEENHFMSTFETDFSRRHASAFKALSSKIGLEYFGIDCAEDSDGRLVIFEADNALIVHDMDDETIYPYKRKHMSRLFQAFSKMLQERCSPQSHGG